MNLPWPAAVTAFFIATILTWVELRTSKYPNTSFLIRWSRPLWIYCFIYGVIALVGFLLSNLLITSAKLKIEGLGLESPYVRAVVMGISAKAIMQLNIFTVTSGATSFPIGFQTIVQLFEPYLLRLIVLDEFNAVRQFVAPCATRHTDLDKVKRDIKQNIPGSLSQQERAAFENEVDKDQRVQDAMERFIRFLGRSTFTRVFP
jgi:hypothetical protein